MERGLSSEARRLRSGVVVLQSGLSSCVKEYLHRSNRVLEAPGSFS